MAGRKAGIKRPKQRSGIGLWWVIALFVLVVVSAFALPTVILLMLGLLPAWVAFIVDRGPGKAAGKCVMSLNVAGAAPYLVNLWTAGGAGQMDNAFIILTDPSAWLVMYGSATLGWLIYFGMPYLVGAIVEMRAEGRKGQLAKLRKAIVVEWGEEIAGVLPQQKK